MSTTGGLALLSMTSHRFTIALVLAGLASCSEPAEPVSRPDVVVFLVDTLRQDRLGCYGYDRPTSPNLDALADQGVVFEDVTAQFPWTLPSMVSLFHGQYLTNYCDSLLEQVATLPEVFDDAGYQSLAVIGNCLVDEGQGFARGFDDFHIVDCWENEEFKIRSKRDIQTLRGMLAEPLKQALAVDEKGERAPLLLYVHAFDPHDEYLPHDELNDELPLGQAHEVEPAGWWDEQLDLLGNPSPKALARRHRDLDRMRLMRSRYDQEIRFFDQGLGDILADLEAAGLSENAVFALVADHGEGLWEQISNESPEDLQTLPPHKFFYKTHGGNGDQTGISTPFVLWGSSIPKGVRVGRAVENVDLLPTLLELADISPPAGLHGRSLVPLLTGEVEAWRTHVFAGGAHTAAVRDTRTQMKLILPLGKSLTNGRNLELYDLGADPGERENLAGTHPEEVLELVGVYDEWVADYPVISNLQGKLENWNREQRDLLGQKLQALGYTELDTGRAESAEDEAQSDSEH